MEPDYFLVEIYLEGRRVDTIKLETEIAAQAYKNGILRGKELFSGDDCESFALPMDKKERNDYVSWAKEYYDP